jgi:hypothetical protein
MLSLPISLVRWSWVAAALLSATALGQELWLLSPVGFGPTQRAMSGAALVSAKGAAALAANPAEVASLRGISLLASGDFALSSVKLREVDTQHSFLARPQVAVAGRLPGGFALGFSWGRGALSVVAPSATGVSLKQVPLHRMLAGVAWEVVPRFRLGAQLQLGVTENAAWFLDERVGKEDWKGGRLAAAARAGASVELLPKRLALALVWEQGLSLSSKREGGWRPELRTPHSLALAAWVGAPGAWEFEVDFVYGWQHSRSGIAGAEFREDVLGVRSGMGLWLTPVIQLRVGGAVFSHTDPPRTSWVQPMDAWTGSLSAGALWRYGPLRAEVAWQTVAGFESSAPRLAPWVQRRISNALSLGLGWTFD